MSHFVLRLTGSGRLATRQTGLGGFRVSITSSSEDTSADEMQPTTTGHRTVLMHLDGLGMLRRARSTHSATARVLAPGSAWFARGPNAVVDGGGGETYTAVDDRLDIQGAL